MTQDEFSIKVYTEAEVRDAATRYLTVLLDSCLIPEVQVKGCVEAFMKRLDPEPEFHVLLGHADTRKVWLDDIELDPAPSLKIHNHSPDGFSWGYEGSGPAQLALAAYLVLHGKPDGYQDFKRQVIAKIPQDQDFKIVFKGSVILSGLEI